MEKTEKYIGVFDSGIGGLTVARQIIKNLPNEKIIYLGDTARVPYGMKSSDTVIKFAKQCSDFLKGFNLKALVIACNTVSSYALSFIKSDVPVIGVIEPGVKKALEYTKNKRIGVIGTRATVNSLAYKNKILQVDSSVKVFQQSCPLFVSLAEEGWIEDKITYDVAFRYLEPFKKQSIDTLILGCTHYPILKKVIAEVMPKEVVLVDSAESVAEILKNLLQNKNLLNNKALQNYTNKFFCTDEIHRFIETGSMFFDFKISEVSRIDLDSCQVKEKIKV